MAMRSGVVDDRNVEELSDARSSSVSPSGTITYERVQVEETRGGERKSGAAGIITLEGDMNFEGRTYLIFMTKVWTCILAG